MVTVLKSAVLVVFLAGSLLFPAKAKEEEKNLNAQVLGATAPEPQSTRLIKSAPEFLNAPTLPELTSKAAFAYDLHSGSILYTNNFDQPLPIASLSKLMTAIIVVENMDLNKIVTVARVDTLVIGTNMGLVDGERIKIIDLLKGLLIPSSNDAAKALARTTAGTEEKFIDMMNAKAKALGMNSTKFTNPTGLDSDDSNYSTTYDMARLVNQFLNNETLSKIVQTKEAEVKSIDGYIFHPLHTTNKLLLENPDVIGVKTGFTSLAKGNLIIRQKHDDAEIITIVLGSDDREADTKRLIDWIFSVYKW